MDETKPMTQEVGGRFLKKTGRNFPGSSVVKTLPSKAGGAASIPGQGIRPHMLWHLTKSKKKKKEKKIKDRYFFSFLSFLYTQDLNISNDSE